VSEKSILTPVLDLAAQFKTECGRRYRGQRSIVTVVRVTVVRLLPVVVSMVVSVWQAHCPLYCRTERSC